MLLGHLRFVELGNCVDRVLEMEYWISSLDNPIPFPEFDALWEIEEQDPFLKFESSINLQYMRNANAEENNRTGKHLDSFSTLYPPGEVAKSRCSPITDGIACCMLPPVSCVYFELHRTTTAMDNLLLCRLRWKGSRWKSNKRKLVFAGLSLASHSRRSIQ